MTADAQREAWRVARRNYRARHEDRCLRCARQRLRGRSCARCLAVFAEKKKRGLEHDTQYHAVMISRATDPTARCAASGLTLAELAPLGQHLEVDRIDPTVGYVRGNCQLLAATLNRSKARDYEVPDYAVDALKRQAAGQPQDWGEF